MNGNHVIFLFSPTFFLNIDFDTRELKQKNKKKKKKINKIVLVKNFY